MQTTKEEEFISSTKSRKQQQTDIKHNKPLFMKIADINGADDFKRKQKS